MYVKYFKSENLPLGPSVSTFFSFFPSWIWAKNSFLGLFVAGGGGGGDGFPIDAGGGPGGGGGPGLPIAGGGGGGFLKNH